MDIIKETRVKTVRDWYLKRMSIRQKCYLIFNGKELPLNQIITHIGFCQHDYIEIKTHRYPFGGSLRL